MARQRRGGARQGNRQKIQPPRKPRIALIGFRGVGKSAIARRLSEHWQMPLVSLDETIERHAGMKIEDIVKAQGWAHFRDLEHKELAQAAALDRVLLDCGGGIVEEADGSPSERKLQILSAAFFCIYISTSEEKLTQRLKNLSRNASRPDLPLCRHTGKPDGDFPPARTAVPQGRSHGRRCFRHQYRRKRISHHTNV